MWPLPFHLTCNSWKLPPTPSTTSPVGPLNFCHWQKSISWPPDTASENAALWLAELAWTLSILIGLNTSGCGLFSMPRPAAISSGYLDLHGLFFFKFYWNILHLQCAVITAQLQLHYNITMCNIYIYIYIYIFKHSLPLQFVTR